MPKLPSFQFYPGDWLKDPSLTLCTPETRGIWIDFICAMHELDHCGVIAGTREQLTRLGRCPLVQLDHALVELSTTKTADVTERHGIVTVICRRMKKEYNKREGNRLRKEKERNKDDVTEMSHSHARGFSSSSSSLEKNIYTKKEDSVIEKYPKTADEVLAVAGRIGFLMTREQAELFLANYSATGWVASNGQPIRNWKALVSKWKVNQYNFKPQKGGSQRGNYKHVSTNPADFDESDDGRGF